MKKILLGAAAAMAIATPAFAVSGHVDGGYATTEYDTGGEFDAFHLGGAVQSDDMGGWTLQLDGRTTLHTWDGSGDDSLGYAALHANTSMGTWDVGGFVGILNYYGDGGRLIGGEARTDFGNISLQGSTAYWEFDQFADYSGWDARVAGSYFVNPNFAINASVSGLWIDTDFTDYDIVELSIGAAYQFSNAIEVYGDYVNTDGEYDTGGGYEADTFRIGVRFHLNGGTLQEETNDGATWEGAEHSHDILTRW